MRAYGLNRRYFRQKSELMQTPPPLLRWPSVDQTAIPANGADPLTLGRALLAAAGVDIQLREGSAPGPTVGFRCHPQLGPYAIAEDAGARHVECLPLDRLRAARLLERGWQQTPAMDVRATLESDLLQLAELVQSRPQIRRLELQGIEQADSGERRAGLRLEWIDDDERSPSAFAPIPANATDHSRWRTAARPGCAPFAPRTSRSCNRALPSWGRTRCGCAFSIR